MNAYEPSHFPAPPRLLLGVTLLVWGALTNHALLAFGGALLIEGAHWLNWRWRFGLRGYSRAWILSLTALAGTVGFHSLNLTGPTAILAFIEWLPFIFLPLILAQQYGAARAVPTSVFSIIARQRLKRERRLGKDLPDSRIHLGYPYFAITLLATAFTADGLKQQWQYFVCMILLAGIAFYYANRRKQRRILPWLIMTTLIGLSSMASSRGLLTLYDWIKKGGFLSSQGQEAPIEQNTAIGKLGELKLSRRIKWRLSVPSGQKPPQRVMTYAYNHYRSGKWQSFDPDFADYERSFSDLLTIADKKDIGEFAFDTDGFQVNDQPSTLRPPIRLRGAVTSNRKALPSPPAPVLFAQATEIDSIEQSQLGTILAINADSVLDIEIWPGNDDSLREAPPTQRLRGTQLLETTSLALPSNSRETNLLKNLVTELALDQKSDREKIKALRSYFQTEFAYTTHLKITARPNRSALTEFLTSAREGHCEYFATATTLLLRASGIPARYAVGYAVRERANNAGEYYLRGTHAHSWCRAYLGGRKEIVEEEQIVVQSGRERTVTIQREVWTGGTWTDIDLTPATWINLDSPDPNWQEKLGDSLQRFREDFQLWRANEKNRDWVNLVLIFVAVALVIFVVWRLSRSRIQQGADAVHSSYQPSRTLSDLNALLPQLEKTLGTKPAHESLTRWLQRVLPEFPMQSYQRLFILHENQRFNSYTLSESEEKEFETLVHTLGQTCAQRKDQ